MHETRLGELIPPNEFRRDAIHVAVAPVTAAEDLSPGQHVGLIRGCEIVGPCDRPVGIVDPFLTEPIKAGDRFWLMLYPQSITGLRHVWSHPSFVRR